MIGIILKLDIDHKKKTMNVNIGTVKIDANDVCKSIAKAIGCDIVYPLPLNVDGELYDIWYDDECKLKTNWQAYMTYLIKQDEEVVDALSGSIVLLKRKETDDDIVAVGFTDKSEYGAMAKFLMDKFTEAQKFVFVKSIFNGTTRSPE